MAHGSLGQRAQATADGLTTARPVELSFRNIQSQLKNLPTPVATRTQQESGVSRVSKRKRTSARPYMSIKISVSAGPVTAAVSMPPTTGLGRGGHGG